MKYRNHIFLLCLAWMLYRCFYDEDLENIKIELLNDKVPQWEMLFNIFTPDCSNLLWTQQSYLLAKNSMMFLGMYNPA